MKNLQNKSRGIRKPTSLPAWELLWRCKRVKGRTSSPSLSLTWFYGKCGAKSGGSDYLELSPGSLYCGCTIGSDENQTSDEEVIKKRKLRNQRENEENGNDDVDGSGNEGKIRKWMFILKWQISTLILQVRLHSSPTVFFCNLVRKLIPN